MKLCTGCGTIKPSSDFTKDSKTKDGLAHKCRECAQALHQRWLEAHPGYGAKLMQRKRAERTLEQHAADNEAARLREEKKRRAAGKQLREERVAAQKAEAARRRADIPSYKMCCACKETKSIDDFNRAKANVDGRVARCRQCASDSELMG